jgi:hypothetical protein
LLHAAHEEEDRQKAQGRHHKAKEHGSSPFRQGRA